MDIEKIKFIGKYWKKGNIERLYFRNINWLIDLRLTFKKDGHILRAYLKGKQISVKEAKLIDARNKEIYYDLNFGRMHYSDDISVETIALIIKALS